VAGDSEKGGSQGQTILLVLAAGAVFLEVTQPGTISKWLGLKGGGAAPVVKPATTCTKTAAQVAAGLGISVQRFENAMKLTKKNPCQITVKDLEGVPDVTGQPGVKCGLPASWSFPTGCSPESYVENQKIRTMFKNAWGDACAEKRWNWEYTKSTAPWTCP
jgi:hypothetical protein